MSSDSAPPAVTRRQFIAATSGAFATMSLSGCRSGPASSEVPTFMSEPPEVFPIDYGRSFLANPSPANSVRFWIESRTILFDDNSDSEPIHFYQCASCKSENTFGEKD